MRTHATRRTLSVLGCALALVAGAATAETGVTDDTIRIGLMVPLTGPAGATVGPGMATGAKTVWTEVNEAGGIHGRKIEWVEEDTGCTAEMGIPAVKKAIHDHQVFMLASGGCSNEILSLPRHRARERGAVLRLGGRPTTRSRNSPTAASSAPRFAPATKACSRPTSPAASRTRSASRSSPSTTRGGRPSTTA